MAWAEVDVDGGLAASDGFSDPASQVFLSKMVGEQFSGPEDMQPMAAAGTVLGPFEFDER